MRCESVRGAILGRQLASASQGANTSTHRTQRLYRYGPSVGLTMKITRVAKVGVWIGVAVKFVHLLTAIAKLYLVLT